MEHGICKTNLKYLDIKNKDLNGNTIDTTVQEKNIIYPTDNKLHRKIISKSKAISEKEDCIVFQIF